MSPMAKKGGAPPGPAAAGTVPMSTLGSKVPAVKLTGNRVFDDVAQVQRDHFIEAINIMTAAPNLKNKAARRLRGDLASEHVAKAAHGMDTWAEIGTVGTIDEVRMAEWFALQQREELLTKTLLALQLHLEDVRHSILWRRSEHEDMDAYRHAGHNADEGYLQTMEDLQQVPAVVPLEPLQAQGCRSRRAMRGMANPFRGLILELAMSWSPTRMENDVITICGTYLPSGWCCDRRVWRKADSQAVVCKGREQKYPLHERFPKDTGPHKHKMWTGKAPTFHAMAKKAAAAVKMRRDAETSAASGSSRDNTAAILVDSNTKQERVATAREALEKKKEETAKERRISLS